MRIVPALLVLATFSLTAQDVLGATLAITGTPPSSATPGQFVAFTPRVSGATRRVTFRIENRPSWMYFSSRNGALYGVARSRQAGSYANISISVSDGTSTAKLAPFTITVRVPGTTPPVPPPTPTPPAPTPTPTPPPAPPPAPANRAPVINGSPAPSVLAGQTYSFTPSASDPDGNSLMFSIDNKPTWATFSTVNGTLRGTPTSSSAGLHSNISIRVSDGTLSATLPSFAINVTVPAPPPPPPPPAPTLGSASLNWTAPTRTTSGTALTTLAGYKIQYGRSATSLSQSVQLANPSLTSHLVENLALGTWYFSVKAYDASGAESIATNPVSVTVR